MKPASPTSPQQHIEQCIAHRTALSPVLVALALLLVTSSLSGQSNGNPFTFLFPGLSDAPPRFTFTAMTEFTDAGRTRGEASPDHPVYYITHSMGYQSKGDEINESKAEREDIEPVLVEALAKSGLRKAGPQNPPQVAIIFMWGSHNPFDREYDAASFRNGMDRAALVGGVHWANRLGRAVNDTEDLVEAMGPTNVFQHMSPIRVFTYHEKNERLLNQVSGRCYFVVASAYDYDLLAKNKRQLLWRTRLTVAANGVSQTQSLPSLISYSARHFGHEMKEPEIVRLPSVPQGHVKMGTPEVVK